MMKTVVKITVLFVVLIFAQSIKADWTKQNVNTLAWLRDVYFLNEQTGWIVGSGGTYLMTRDGGKNWTKEKKVTEDNIRQIYYADEQNGWLLCERDVYALGTNSPSYLLKTTNGGVNWERVEFAGNQRQRVTKVFFTKSGAGLAIGEGGAFYALADDRQTWQRAASPARYLLFDGVFTGNVNGVVVGAGSTILYTENAGSSWNNASIFGEKNVKLNAVFFINQRNGWTVGASGKIFQTMNGGKLWREQKSNVADDLTDIFFTNTANGWAVGADGTILSTETAGNVWTASKSNFKHRLEKVFFAGKRGWAVGFGGTILSYQETVQPPNNSLPPPKLSARN